MTLPSAIATFKAGSRSAGRYVFDRRTVRLDVDEGGSLRGRGQETQLLPAIRTLNRGAGMTVMITSHDMTDIVPGERCVLGATRSLIASRSGPSSLRTIALLII